MSEITRSNSLADLAARINAEHKASGTAFKCSVEHVIRAGELLIEAKGQVPHGQWLPWLEANCTVSVRTAQAYMQVAGFFGKLDDGAKAQRVADLSFRDALSQLAVTGRVAEQLPAESFERAVERAEDSEKGGLRRGVEQARREDRVARYSLETPLAMLPGPSGRKMRVARNPKKRQWLLAIGPDVSRVEMLQRQRAANEDEEVILLRQEQQQFEDRAGELEAEAKRLREQAGALGKRIGAEVADIIGQVHPFSETYDFQVCDAATDSELAALPQEQLVDRLLAARNSRGGALQEIERGYWGDMTLWMGSFDPGPGAWTKVGSPEWLGEMFPGLNEPELVS